LHIFPDDWLILIQGQRDVSPLVLFRLSFCFLISHILLQPLAMESAELLTARMSRIENITYFIDDIVNRNQIVLPNPNDVPTKSAQLTVHAAVAGLVHGKFRLPECTIASGNFAVFGAAVPKTAVHEDSHPGVPKKKIRPAEYFLIPSPAGDVMLAE
jgi:hypothetical protein